MTKHDDYILYYSDLKRWFVKLRLSVFKVMGACFLVCLVFLSQRELKYQAEATFRHAHQRSKDLIQLNKLVSKILPSQTESSAISLMTSKLILKQAMEDLGLQMLVQPHFFTRPMNVGRQFLFELGIPPNKRNLFSFSSVHYSGKNSSTLYLKCLSSEQFEIYDRKKQLLRRGNIKEQIVLDSLSFTVESIKNDVVLGKWYCIRVLPSESVVNDLRKNLTVKINKNDSHLLQLHFSHPDPVIAADVVNQVMYCFEQFVKSEHEEEIKAQLAYLQTRQQDLMNLLDHSLGDYVAYLKKVVSEEGFTGSAQQIEMLALPQQEFTSKLFDLEIEYKRWKNEQDVCLEQKNDSLSKPSDIQQQLASLDFSHIKELPLSEKAIDVLHDIDLPTAHILYQQYSREIQETLKNIQEWEDILNQIPSPEMDISSLSPILIDPVSQEMIRKAATISLELRDEQNRSSKEHERLKTLLDIQKEFLSGHLKQRIHFADLKLKTLETNMQSLRETALFLVENEKNLVQEKLSDLQQKINNFPEKWKLENELKFRKKIIKTMVESLTHMVESKMADQHLFRLESKPLDLARIPELPLKPHLLLFALVGTFAGGLGYLVYQFFKSVSSGFMVSSEGIKQLQQPYFGSLHAPLTSLDRLKENELNSFRKALQFMEVHEKGVSLILGKGAAELSVNLAELISLQGVRLLLIDLIFHKDTNAQGLWHYVEGADASLCIQKGEFDQMDLGAAVPFIVEWMQHEKFIKALERLKTNYDLILLSTPASLSSPEAQVLHRIVRKTLAILHEETYPELLTALDWDANRDKSSFGFMMCV